MEGNTEQQKLVRQENKTCGECQYNKTEVCIEKKIRKLIKKNQKWGMIPDIKIVDM